eukprot:UN14408
MIYHLNPHAPHVRQDTRQETPNPYFKKKYIFI